MNSPDNFETMLKSMPYRKLRWLSKMLLKASSTNTEWNQIKHIPLHSSELLIHTIMSIINKEQHKKHLETIITRLINVHLVSDKEFDWISPENPRLLGFIYFETLKTINNIDLSRERQIRDAQHVTPPPPTVNGYVENDHTRTLIPATTQLDLNEISLHQYSQWYTIFIEAFDDWSETIEIKIKHLNNLRSKWDQVQDNNKLAKWLDQSNSLQINWTWIYIAARLNSVMGPIKYPKSKDEKYFFSLIALDNHKFDHEAEKSIFIDRLKRSWSQQKFRASGRTKMPYYIPLSTATRKKLSKISKETGKSISDVITELTELYSSDIK